MTGYRANNQLSSSDTVEISITDIAVGGKGIGRFNGKVIFVEKGLPGQQVRVQLYKKRKNYSEGRIVDLLENSPAYEKPRCSHFSVCGGCTLQNAHYKEQLKYKKQWIADTLQRIGGITDCDIRETVPSPDIYFYRNKMEFSFSDKEWDTVGKKIRSNRVGLGLHLPGRYDTIVSIEKCFLQSEISNRIVNLVRNFAVKSGLPAYNIQRHRGYWRFLVIREGKLTGERLINIITYGCSSEERDTIHRLADMVMREIPEVTAFYHAEHSGKSQAAVWDTIRNIYGGDFIHEKIDQFIFKIDCDTFFQINSRQTEKLYEIVKKAGKFTGNEIVYDLFSGVGTISVYLSESVRSLIGMEVEPRSVEVANENAQLNNVTNCRFVQGRVRSLIKYTPKVFRKYGQPDVVIVDPPRSGLDQKTTERVMQLNAGRIIYVSCNPATLARDLKVFVHGYQIENVVPVDMFPHTPHVESVTALLRIDESTQP